MCVVLPQRLTSPRTLSFMSTSWNPALETGHPHIDAEHRELLEQLAAVKTAIDQGAGREQIAALITVLQKYVLGHFAREEGLMERKRCPARETNRAAHREFARKLDGWLVLLTSGVSPYSLMRDVHREATDWIVAHIVQCDCQLRQCLPD